MEDELAGGKGETAPSISVTRTQQSSRAIALTSTGKLCRLAMLALRVYVYIVMRVGQVKSPVPVPPAATP